ncbi:MAG: hypothetical protein FWD05_00980 [Oscillospiraceae bacterium]|nr:hypothetical protein [Oscillospiraceae bacterium]
MSEMFVNNSGVQSQSSSISSSTNATEQSTANYISQSSSHQGGLDGAARYSILQFSGFTRQTTDAACVTLHNLSVFIRNAAQAAASVDQSQSRRFITDQ